MKCKIWIIFFLFMFLGGCSYSRNLRLPTVLTSKDELFAIPSKTPFTAIKDAGQEPKTYIVDEPLVVMRMGNYQELLEKSDQQFFKRSHITKKQMMVGGGVTSVLGILATVFWNRRRKFKIDGNIKAEG